MKEIFFLITCVYNGEKYLSKLFQSLINQSEYCFVHYILNDGSTDNTDSLIANYKQNVESNNLYKIIYKKTKNNGLNTSMKTAISDCFCPYFIWIDCDNWIDKDFFKNLALATKNNKNAIVFRTHKITYDETLNRYFDHSGNFFEKAKRNITDNRSLVLLNSYDYSFFAVNFNKYKRLNPNLFLSTNKYPFDDQQVIFISANSGYEFAYVKKAKGYFLRHDNNLSISKVYKNSFACFVEFIKHLDFINCKQIKVDTYEELLLLKKNYFNEYSQRNYLVCRKILIKKNQVLRSLKLPFYSLSLNRFSLLFFLSLFFPRVMSRIMIARDRK